MIVSTMSPGRAALLLAPLVSLFLSSMAHGQDEPPPSAPSETSPVSPGAAPAEPPRTAGGLVEQLPASAYPEWTNRGIPGGSLWFSGNMHGMPWPYYPRTGVGVSGYVWLDTGYENLKRGNPAEPKIKYLISQGRALLRLTPTYSRGTFYIQGQTEFVGNKDQTIAQPQVADIDDLWVRVGQWRKWDLQVGRFEAFETYHFGMAMDLNTLERNGAADQLRAAPDVYGLTTITYRQSGIGNVALHLYGTNILGADVRLELLGQFGFDSSTGIDTVGGRPGVVLDWGWLKLKGEGDIRKQFPIVDSSKESRFQRGGSGSVQVVMARQAEFGVNGAYGLVDHFNATNLQMPQASMGDQDTTGSVTDVDFGGFANAMLAEDLIAGVGANYNVETDLVNGRFTHLQTFGAVQMRIGQQLFVKLVGSYAKAHFAPGGTNAPVWDNTMLSGRLRLMYLF